MAVSPTLTPVDPVIVVTKSALNAAVEAAVEKAVRRVVDARTQVADEPGGKAWLTNKEAQVYLQLSKATLARYRSDGTLPYSRLGSSVYYRLADVESLLDRHAVRAGYGDSTGGNAVPVLATP